MAYDVVEDAKSIDALSDSVCKLVNRLGQKAVNDAYAGRSSEDDALIIKLFIDSYADEKRRFTLNLLKWPHQATTITSTDPAAVRVLERTGRGEPLPADKIVQPLVASDTSKFEQFGLLWSYIPDEEAHNISWDSFHGWHGTEGYLAGIIAARPVVVPVAVPRTLSSMIDEIRMCYAFGQSIAIYGLCRTMFETALTDVCVRVGALTRQEVQKADFFRNFRPKRRIDRTLQGSAHKEASALYCKMSRVIHGLEAPDDIHSTIQKTFNLIERLYAQNASKITKREVERKQ